MSEGLTFRMMSQPDAASLPKSLPKQTMAAAAIVIIKRRMASPLCQGRPFVSIAAYGVLVLVCLSDVFISDRFLPRTRQLAASG